MLAEAEAEKSDKIRKDSEVKGELQPMARFTSVYIPRLTLS